MTGSERESAATNIRLCLDCGKCTVVCPVAQRDSDFNPRLIAQRWLTRPTAGPVDETIWDCLSCYMCVERCNYLVRFPEFIHAARAEALAEGARLQCTHGGVLQSYMHMMARGDLQQERLGWLPEDIELAEGSETVFFTGCAPYFDVVFDEMGVHTLDGVKGAMRLLNEAGIPFDVIRNERCCGKDLLSQGDTEGFLTLAGLNSDEFKKRGVKRIITNCAECMYCLSVDYPRALGESGIEVQHVSQVLAPLIESGELKLGEADQTATYQDPCALGRCSRVFEQPRRLLDAIEGLTLTEMQDNREKALCCGASPWVHCRAVNRMIQADRLAQASATGASVLVTACPKCQIHLTCAQRGENGSGKDIEIEDLAYLAARSLERR